jgi:hypothetical protein
MKIVRPKEHTITENCGLFLAHRRQVLDATNANAWELHIFPGGKVGEARTRFGVYLWIFAHYLTHGEKRAINRLTGQHIVK